MFGQINSKHPDYLFRYLLVDDYHRGLFETLNQLTKAPTPKYEQFLKHLEKMENSPNYHANIVGIDRKNDKVIAFGTLLVCEGPFGKVGKIENIVTCKSARGKGLGKCIIQLLKYIGWDERCNKITLFCEEKNIKFYNILGFQEKGKICAHYTT